MMGGSFLVIIKNNLVKTLCYILDKSLFGNSHNVKPPDLKALNSILIARYLFSGSANRLSV